MRIAIVIVLMNAGLAVVNARESTATRDEPLITVGIHDYARIAQHALIDAQRLVTGFYAVIGVKTEWAATQRCRSNNDTARADDRPEDLTVIVLSREMAARKRLSSDAIGSAAVGLGGAGRIAYVLYERVENAAVASDWPTTELLAVVIAHELGHLLLPHGSHSPAGLMRGDWNVEDLRRTHGRRLAFTPGQGALMREMLGYAAAAQ